MNDYASLSLALILSVLSVLACLFLWGMFREILKSKNQEISNLSTLLNDQRKISADMLNRLMSEDLPTYSALKSQTHPTSAFSPYQPKTDAAELAQLHDIYGGAATEYMGVGETVYDDVELDGLNALGSYGGDGSPTTG